jgi:hypothetical protein
VLKQNEFETAVAHYLKAGMPEKHGLSEDEYIARCKQAWDDCQTDDQYPFKLLVDKLWSETMLPKYSGQDYIDPRSKAAEDIVERPLESIYCIAVGDVSLLDLLHGQESSVKEPSRGDNVRTSVNEVRSLDFHIVALFDVLGFEAMYREIGPHQMKAKYDRLVEVARTKTDVQAIGMASALSDGMNPMLFHLDISFHYFSDTLLFWVPLEPQYFSPFFMRCIEIFLEAMKIGVPLRGAIAAGEAIMDKKEGVFLGTPIIDAARLEVAQDWLGVALAGSLGDDSILRELDSGLVLPYTPPCKADRPVLHAGFVLDWPRRAREQGLDIMTLMQQMDQSEPHGKYYDNALTFVNASAANRRWNRDTRVPVILGALKGAIIRSRSCGLPLDVQANAILETIGSMGTKDANAAAYLRALAEGVKPEIDFSALPEGSHTFIANLEEVLNQDVVDVGDLVLGALEARAGVREFESYRQAALTRLEAGRPTSRECARLVMAILNGNELPRIPENLPDEIRKQWREAEQALSGNTPPVDMESLMADIIFANARLVPLSPEGVKRLDIIESMTGDWPAIGSYLRRFASGEEIIAMPDIHTASSFSTVRVIQQIEAWQTASRFSVLDACRGSLRPGPTPSDLTGLIDAILGESEKDIPLIDSETISRIECAGSPHDAVGRFFRTIVESESIPDIPGGVPEDVKQFLNLVRDLKVHRTCSIPEQYLVMTALQARSNGTGLGPYDTALFRIISEQESDKTYIGFLIQIADGRPLSSIPKSLPKSVREYLSIIKTAVGQARKNRSFEDAGEQALRIRQGENQSPDIINELVELGKSNGEPYKSIGQFMLKLAYESDIPEVPEDIPETVRLYLYKLRLEGLTGVNPTNLNGLISSALTFRWHGKAMNRKAQQYFDSLLKAGGPYTAIHDFVGELMTKGSFPELPESIPFRTLMVLAQARREAIKLENTRIAVSKSPLNPNTCDDQT